MILSSEVEDPTVENQKGVKAKEIVENKPGIARKHMDSPRILSRTSAKCLRFMIQTLNLSSPRINSTIQ
jgi:hypothetical protein